MGTVREPLAEGTEGAPHLGPERPRVTHIYTLINHYTDAKDIWDNVKMLLEGSELTKEDQESQLCDDFEHFQQHKEETIHDYYVRFAKLINDMRNIKMTMFRMQLNSKFVNNMLHEWGRFVTAVKLNIGLRDSNYDQLYGYPKQHEAHANENKMMLDRFTQHTVDPLALMSNVSHQQHYSQSSSTPPSIYVPPHLADNAHLDSGLSPTDNLIENLTKTLALRTKSYKTFLPQINNQLRTSSNTRNQAIVQDGRVVVQNVHGRQNRGQGTNPQGGGAVRYGGVKNRVGNANPGQARQVKCYNYNGGQDNAIDEDMDEQPVQDLALNVDNVFQADDCDLFDSDVDEAPTTQTMFMANMSSADHVYDEAGPSYDSDILSEVHDHDHYQDVVCAHHEEHAMHDNVQINHIVDSHADYTSDCNMIPYNQYVKDDAVPGVHSNPALYNGHEIIKDNHVSAIVHNTKDTLEIAKITRRKINDQIKDTECVNHKVKIAPHDYSKENFLATFTPQKQLTPEQIFWSQDLIKLRTEALKEQTTTSRPIKALTVYPPNTPATLVPRVLPMKSQVKIHIFTLIQLFLEFDTTCIKRITPIGLTKGEKGFEETKECYLKEKCFSVATNSKLNVARFTKMHVAHTIVEARCLELEAELSNLHGKSHNDNHNELVNRFSNLEYAIDVEPIPSLLRHNRDAHLDYLMHLKKSVETIRDIVEEAKVIMLAVSD
nr:hypothetical protein [Tanacetum cinerariifolium]